MTPYQRSARGVFPGPAFPARTGVTLLARVRMGTGQLATRASLSAVSYAVTDVTRGVALGSGSFGTATIADQLTQNDQRWRLDSQASPGPDGDWGYNWAAALPASLFPLTAPSAPGVLTGEAGASVIQCDVTFTPVTGEEFRLIFRWQMLPTYG